MDLYSLLVYWQPIGMVDHFRSSLCQRHVEGIEHQLDSEMVGHKPAGGDTQQPAHHPNRIGGLVRFQEFEDRFVFGTVS